MTDVFLPVSVDVASIKFRYLESTGVSRNPYSGAVRTASRGGDKIGASLEFTPTGGASTTGRQKQRILKSRLWGANGKQGRFILADPSCTPAGSFPTSELISNNTFDNGTTGFTAGTDFTISVTDRVLRAKRTAMTAATNLFVPSAVTTVAYAPYVTRYFWSPNRSGVYSHQPTYSGVGAFGSSATTSGLITAVTVVSNTSVVPAISAPDTTGWFSGDYVDVPYISTSRCAVADGGGNMALYSDQLNDATYTKVSGSVSTNYSTAPDGTVTADRFVPAAAAAQHYFYQVLTISSAAAQYFFGMAFKASGYSYVRMQMDENTSGTSVYQTFDVSTGAIGVTTSTGANWSSLRSYISPMGGGWYYCAIVARKTNAATSLNAVVSVHSTDSATSWTGDGSNGVLGWRFTVANSALPGRLTQSTTVAVSSSSQTGGSLYLRGLPASTSGLLLYGDWVEVITSLGSQLCMVISSLDSDAAGLGYLQVSPPIRGTAADNAAVIVHRPMGRFVSASDAIEFLNEPGIITTSSLDLEESPF